MFHLWDQVVITILSYFIRINWTLGLIFRLKMIDQNNPLKSQSESLDHMIDPSLTIHCERYIYNKLFRINQNKPSFDQQ